MIFNKLNFIELTLSYAVTGDGKVSVRILEGEGWTVEDENGTLVFTGGNIGSEALDGGGYTIRNHL